MTYKCALLCMHGMGDLDRKSFQDEIKLLKNSLRKHLLDQFDHVYIPDQGIFYSDLTENYQLKIIKKMQKSISPNLYSKIRDFCLYGFSDAVAFCTYHSAANTQQYTAVQDRIYQALRDVRTTCGDVPVIILTQSLGCQILSNYLWDAQVSLKGHPHPASIWAPAQHSKYESSDFLTLKTLKTWITTGCNIPIFVSGFEHIRAVETERDGYNFKWINIYDKDDVLGFPLTPLSVSFDQGHSGHGQSYDEAVKEDIQLNAGNGFFGRLKGMTPLSHLQYWTDKKVLNIIADRLKLSLT